MKTNDLTRTILFFLSILYSSFLFGQSCSATAPASGACSGTQLTNGNTYTISGGSYYYPASSGTISISQISGGTLMVCGNLTISSFGGYYGGTVIIEPGGSLTIGSSASNVSITMDAGSIANYGTFTINGSLTLYNGAQIWNQASSQGFTVAGSANALKLEGGVFVDNANNSAVTVPTLILQGGSGSLCMGNLAIIDTDSIYNTTTNSVAYNGSISSACIGISVGSNLANTALTNSSMISVCLSPGERQTNSNWGSAIVSTNCTGCNIALPLNITGFTASLQPGFIRLGWSASGLTGTESFEVQKSDNAMDFYAIATVRAVENQNQYSSYDYQITQEVQYYRIKELNSSGKEILSMVQMVNTGFTPGQTRIAVYPNPVRAGHALNIQVNSTKQENAILSVLSIDGRLIQSANYGLGAGNNRLQLNLRNIPAGIYILKTQTLSQGAEFTRISVLRNSQ